MAALPVHWLNLQRGARLCVADRGYRYGDSLFESLRVHNGRYLLRDYHEQRLAAGCEVLGIPLDRPRLEAQLELGLAWLAGHSLSGAYARLSVSRGGTGAGYRPQAAPANLLLSLRTADLCWRDSQPPAALIRCETRLAEQPQLAGLKHGNRLEQVLAARELAEQGADEGLLLNARDQVLGAVAANVFAVFEQQLVTPPLERAGVAGTVRRYILEQLAPQLGFAVREQALPWTDLPRASEMFISNALIGIRTVAAIPGRRFTRWPYADRLREQYFAGLEGAV